MALDFVGDLHEILGNKIISVNNLSSSQMFLLSLRTSDTHTHTILEGRGLCSLLYRSVVHALESVLEKEALKTGWRGSK